MNKTLKNRNNIIRTIIVVIVLLLGFICVKHYFKRENIILNNAEFKESKPISNGFALMLEQADGTYKESESTKWPTNMKFNSELSKCIDIYGNIIENALSYDNETKLAQVNVTGTSYCYIYFDSNNLCKQNETLSDCIIRNSNEGLEEIWNSTLEDDGYRFVGNNPNNYICFGTTDQDVCKSNPSTYMYRIIGVFEGTDGNQYVKIIKKEALDTAYKWYDDKTSDKDWNETDLYMGINGDYFLNNPSYLYMQDSSWINKISLWNYTMTNTKTLVAKYGPSYYYTPVQAIYLHELNRKDKVNQTCYYNSSNASTAYCSNGSWNNLNTKVSLMYVSDYQLSLGSEALDYSCEKNASTLKTGWIQLSNNDSNPPSTYEWTMTRSDTGGTNYHACRLLSNGTVDSYYIDAEYAIRPVFYLQYNILNNGGSGSIDEPIMIL